MSKEKKPSSGRHCPQSFNDERGLKPAKNPPKMPAVKLPKYEKTEKDS
jgi:hypothetical protein